MDDGEEDWEEDPKENHKDATEHVDDTDGAEEGADHSQCWIVLLVHLYLGLGVHGIVQASKH